MLKRVVARNQRGMPNCREPFCALLTHIAMRYNARSIIYSPPRCQFLTIKMTELMQKRMADEWKLETGDGLMFLICGAAIYFLDNCR